MRKRKIDELINMDNKTKRNQENKNQDIVISNERYNKDKEMKLHCNGYVQIHLNDKLIQKVEDDDEDIDSKLPLDITLEGIMKDSNEILYENVAESQKNIRTPKNPCSVVCLPHYI